MKFIKITKKNAYRLTERLEEKTKWLSENEDVKRIMISLSKK